MKKSIGLMVVFVLALGFSVACAEDMKDGTHHKKGKMGMEHGMMMKMMEKTVVATADGGVVILSGHTLSKYDKNLNLVKEVQLTVDMEGMKKCMEEMKEMCPLKGKESGDDTDISGDAHHEAPAVAPAAVEEAPAQP